MSELQQKLIFRLVYAVLNDDQGINETAYNALVDVVNECLGNVSILSFIKSADGRYYLNVFNPEVF